MTSQKPETTYTCKECGVVVLREGNEFHRACECNGAIVASLHATAYGISSVADAEKRAS